MQAFRKASIQHKQTAIIMLTTSVALLLVCAAFVSYEVFTFRKSMVANLTTHAEIIGNNSSAALDFNDKEAAEETISALRAEPDIVAACIYLRDGTVFVEYTRPGDTQGFEPPAVRWEGHEFGEQHLGLFRPITQKGEIIGAVYLRSDLNALYQRLHRYALIVAAVLGIALLVAYYISKRLQRVISEPILELVRTTKAVTQNEDYSVRVPRHNDDELGVLIEGFNGMLAQVQARDAALQKAQAELERRVEERTRELANSLSLLHATLESTADGILVTDCMGNVTSFNERFLSMWNIHRDLAKSESDQGLINAVLPQVKDADAFVLRISQLYGRPDVESFDTVEFQDGKVFERHSKPQKVGQKHVGRVWSFRDVTDRRNAEAELREMHSQLLNASRQAGMAEIATNVLHNVGNVLNSVNVSSSIIADSIRGSKLPNLERVVSLLEEHKDNLPDFFSNNPKGKQVLPFLAALSTHLHTEKDKLLHESESLRRNVEHINKIVAMQQQYARMSGVLDIHDVKDLVEDAVRMNADGMERNDVVLLRDYVDVPQVLVDKHKVLQILVNLIRNARQAVHSSNSATKTIALRIAAEDDFVRISVTDNGIGIAAENMVKIFSHGFTTRREGHGFGLHSCALAAKELGGTITVQSEGVGKGATFTLTLPEARKASLQVAESA